MSLSVHVQGHCSAWPLFTGAFSMGSPMDRPHYFLMCHNEKHASFPLGMN